MLDRLPYLLLRRKLKAYGFNQDDVAVLLERSRQYVSDRMRAKGEWHIDEAYKLLEAIEAETNELYRYFPSNPYMVIETPKKVQRSFRLVEVPFEEAAL